MQQSKNVQFYKWKEENRLSLEAYNYLSGNYNANEIISREVGEYKISIVIITHNRRSLLEKVIAGIDMQDYTNYEIIIVDDASDDDTEEYVKQLKNDKIIYIRNNENKGASYSRKTGYHHTSGEIIIFSDDDDYYIDPTYFKQLVKLFSADKRCVMVCASSLIRYAKDGSYSDVFGEGLETVSTHRYINGFCSEFSKPMSSFTLALRKKALDSINYSDLKCFNDTSLYLYALLCEGNVAFIQNAIGVYNIHNNNMSKGTSVDFIIENLNSKLDIYRIAKDRKCLEKPYKWLYFQTMVTVNYYYSGYTNNNAKLLRWCFVNIHGIYKIIICLKIIKYSILSKKRLRV